MRGAMRERPASAGRSRLRRRAATDAFALMKTTAQAMTGQSKP